MLIRYFPRDKYKIGLSQNLFDCITVGRGNENIYALFSGGKFLFCAHFDLYPIATLGTYILLLILDQQFHYFWSLLLCSYVFKKPSSVSSLYGFHEDFYIINIKRYYFK